MRKKAVIARASAYEPLTPPDSASDVEPGLSSLWVNHVDAADLDSAEEYTGDFFMPDGQAENCAMSLKEAKQYARLLLKSYENQTGLLDFQLIGILAHSRCHVDLAEVDGEIQNPDLSQPGYYELYFYQQIQGMPIVNNGYDFTRHRKNKRGYHRSLRKGPTFRTISSFTQRIAI